MCKVSWCDVYSVDPVSEKGYCYTHYDELACHVDHCPNPRAISPHYLCVAHFQANAEIGVCPGLHTTDPARPPDSLGPQFEGCYEECLPESTLCAYHFSCPTPINRSTEPDNSRADAQRIVNERRRIRERRLVGESDADYRQRRMQMAGLLDGDPDSTSEVPDGRSRYVPENVKRAVWDRDDGRCVKCGGSENLEFDHDIPFSMGGSNAEKNIQLLCASCNRTKGASIE